MPLMAMRYKTKRRPACDKLNGVLAANPDRSAYSVNGIISLSPHGQKCALDNFKNGQMSEIEANFNPPIYNIWNLQKQDNATDSHFGSFPLYFMKSLLYYHTKPWDIVFDPFAGGGTTIDACKEMLRRYYCTDRIVKPGREKDIQQHDIKDGLPDGMPKPDLVFLDPPYWKQAEGLYSNDPEDLANMSLDDFYKSVDDLIMAIWVRQIKRIAIVIQPTQYKNNFVWEDHILNTLNNAFFP